jgi:hypothetical protein
LPPIHRHPDSEPECPGNFEPERQAHAEIVVLKRSTQFSVLRSQTQVPRFSGFN